MDVSANAIRDTVIQSLALAYDWETETHTAKLGVRSSDGTLHVFQITGVSQVEISEDFGSRYIEFCSLIRSPGRIYLSLDPYEEGVESERDNFSFVGIDITMLDGTRL
jgi:hypothetical protein